MVHKYKKRVGARPYANYSSQDLGNAISKVISGELSQKAASAMYKIPRGTIQNKIKNRHRRSPGHPMAFTAVEEHSFVEHLKQMSAWGFPICQEDLQIVVKMYLDKKGVEHKAFKQNYPGVDWVKGFLKRHNGDIQLRTASNINSRRFLLKRDEIKDYMARLKETLEGIDPTNIINYDETAMSDDPGRKKMIFQKGQKYAETKMNSTKSNISIMFAASASGHLLPPYVIYKAKNIYSGWTERGPENARYAATSHGWIDNIAFSDWFNHIIIPYRKKNPGKFAMIGDNLASHLSEDIIAKAIENQIEFVFLPPNSTHLTQPLDVAVFRSLKASWRKVLFEWKTKNPNKLSIEKSSFPALLKDSLENITNMKSNIESGFKTTGIFPWNETELLKKFPSDEDFNPDLVSTSFISHLSKSKGGGEPARKRGKKFHVLPGQSVSSSNQREMEETSESDEYEPGDIPNEVDLFVEIGNSEGESQEIIVPSLVLASPDDDFSKLINTYVIVRFETVPKGRFVYYVGFIENFEDGEFSVYYFRKSEKDGIFIFSEPNVKDSSTIVPSEVVAQLPPPKLLQRGKISFDFCFEPFETIY